MSDEVQRLDIGGIFSTAMADIGRDGMRYGACVVVVGLVAGGIDTYEPVVAGNIAGNIALFFVSVLAVYFTLQKRLSGDEIAPRFVAAFGLSLLTGIGILVGLVFLVVPGLMLLTRWAVSLPAMLRENLSVLEAMARSTALTEGNRWRILGLGLLIWVPFLIIMAAIGGLLAAFAGEESMDTLVFNIFVNMAAGGATILSSVCWSEAYLALAREDESGRSLAQIFA
ncbi:hypothetical protein ASE85_16450 [Sphingobium sp. Leaf26]|uniref:glycerophosphoryl diester phosphodiesterase membrane domain-containing protein n=1 Tax=Sphingobium sp. Leaf26 TaxID=1735693 RepID=UPI0006FC3E1E|nr:glycerophosphoryl diester phosphodiesterase membrane domain-containing protein [Sphingobium sp. Leaf26]KQN08530.1 hypothetical protein ASE85_16450 [Sphingobium sp. Leaf26]